jgi:hypothetical protein
MAIVVLRRASDGFFGRLDADQPAADDDSDSDILPGVAREVIACAVVMIVLAAAIVGLRTYCRAYVLRKMGKDDWVIIVGLVSPTFPANCMDGH